MPQNEEKEVERLVRKSPKVKPPRHDRRRERVESDSERDPDLDNKDKSLNYKVVGKLLTQRDIDLSCVLGALPPGSVRCEGSTVFAAFTPKAADLLGILPGVFVPVSTISDADISKVCAAFLVMPDGNPNNSTFRSASFVEPKLGSESASLGGEVLTPKESSMVNKKQANSILTSLDSLAEMVQKAASQGGLPLKTAEYLVTRLDKIADASEIAFFGKEAFERRQAKVLQRDADEAYMSHFDAPENPEVEADEPYMGAFDDDQFSAVIDGVDSNGRELAPSFG